MFNWKSDPEGRSLEKLPCHVDGFPHISTIALFYYSLCQNAWKTIEKVKIFLSKQLVSPEHFCFWSVKANPPLERIQVHVIVEIKSNKAIKEICGNPRCMVVFRGYHLSGWLIRKKSFRYGLGESSACTVSAELDAGVLGQCSTMKPCVLLCRYCTKFQV